MQACAVYATAALVFQLMMVACCVMIHNVSAAIDHSSFEQHGFGQGGLAASVGSKDRDVLNVFKILCGLT